MFGIKLFQFPKLEFMVTLKLAPISEQSTVYMSNLTQFCQISRKICKQNMTKNINAFYDTYRPKKGH